MSEMTLLLEEEEEEEVEDMGSYNHSTVQANLAFVFKQLGNYSVAIELSLDSSSLDKTRYNVKDELIPDVCIYPKRDLSIPFDILKMDEMPLLVVEVLSPRQFIASLLEKFRAYFALGIISCWLVEPTTRTVHVYTSMTQWQTFTVADVIHDPALNIDIPCAEVFV